MSTCIEAHASGQWSAMLGTQNIPQNQPVTHYNMLEERTKKHMFERLAREPYLDALEALHPFLEIPKAEEIAF